MMTDAAIFERFKAANAARSMFDALYKEAYRYGIAERNMYNNRVQGSVTTTEIYDSTAGDSNNNFANLLHDSLYPRKYRWFEFRAGTAIPVQNRELARRRLDEVTEQWFALFDKTNFHTEIQPALKDLGAGTAALAIRDYSDPEIPATFQAVPLNELYVAPGRENHLTNIFRKWEIEADIIKTTWPDAEFGEDDISGGSAGTTGHKIEVLEASYFDYDAKEYHYRVYIHQSRKCIVTRTQAYSPWIVFRWDVVSGESYGRGPLIAALPDIRTANQVVEFTLKNASIELAGVYTAVDDGVLNPHNIVLEPGTVIPVAYNGGNFGRSLDLLPRSTNFDLSSLVLSDLRQSIRRKLLDDDFAPLDAAVRSAEEVVLRKQQSLSKRAGPALGRVDSELTMPLIRNLTIMWQKKGLLPSFEIDGNLIDVGHTSPLSKLQADEDLANNDQFIARLRQYHPSLPLVAINPAEYVKQTAMAQGINASLTEEENKMMAAIEALFQTAQGAGTAAPAAAQELTREL